MKWPLMMDRHATQFVWIGVHVIDTSLDGDSTAVAGYGCKRSNRCILSAVGVSEAAYLCSQLLLQHSAAASDLRLDGRRVFASQHRMIHGMTADLAARRGG